MFPRTSVLLYSRMDDSSLNPHIAQECSRDILNFFNEFPMTELEPILDNAANKSTGEIHEFITNLTLWLKELDSVAVEPCQKVLFDLPFYYVGT